MIALQHQSHSVTEDQEVLLLSCFQGMRLKERQNDPSEMFQLSHAVTHSVTVIASHNATVEKLLDCVKDLNVSFMLHDYEFRQHLHTERHLRMGTDSNVETAFPVREADDPLCSQIHWVELMGPNIKPLRVLRPDYKLLVGIFPADCLRVWLDFYCPASTGRVPPSFEEFPAYGSVLLRLAMAYLRTVIVTAAVYRGFGCQLRGEPLTDFLNLPAPSRRHSVYIHLRVSTELCF